MNKITPKTKGVPEKTKRLATLETVDTDASVLSSRQKLNKNVTVVAAPRQWRVSIFITEAFRMWNFVVSGATGWQTGDATVVHISIEALGHVQMRRSKRDFVAFSARLCGRKVWGH